MPQTSNSVTKTPCTCGGLEHYKNSPLLPIEYDVGTNEYSFAYPVYGRKSPLILYGKISIYHCPFCGGVTPDVSGKCSIVISNEEFQRLTELLKDLKSLEEAIERFGLPDHDFSATSLEDFEKYGYTPDVRWHRTIVFENLSETAKIQMTDYGLGRIEIGVKNKNGQAGPGSYPFRVSDPVA